MWAVAAQPRVGLTPMIPTPSFDSPDGIVCFRKPPASRGQDQHGHLLLDAQVPEHVDGALVGDVGGGELAVLAYFVTVMASTPDRASKPAGRQPRRASTNHENVGFGGAHRKKASDQAT